MNEIEEVESTDRSFKQQTEKNLKKNTENLSTRTF